MTATTVSLFCGAGGESLGKHAALRELGLEDSTLISHAVNHWDLAVQAHGINLPNVLVHQEDITQVTAASYGLTRIQLLWASPSCVHHSRARAGKPKSDQQRSHAWEVTEELVRALELTPFAKDEFLGAYVVATDPLERARNLIIRSFQGFGSNGANRKTGFRADTKRAGTCPATDWRRYPQALVQIIERLQGVVVENRDALDVLQIHDSLATLHYVDPPYLPETRDAGRDYRHEMTLEDHERLAVVLQGLKGHVLLSGYDSHLYADLYPGWRRLERNALADKAAVRLEVLWFSPNCPDLGFFPQEVPA